MASLVNRSVVTIQKIELGKLPLGDELANEFTRQTGVDLNWLKRNDTSKPPVEMISGKSYTRKHFEEAQANLKHQFGTASGEPVFVRLKAFHALSRIAAIASEALKANKFILFAWKIQKALDLLQDEFGMDLLALTRLGAVEFEPTKDAKKDAAMIEVEAGRALAKLWKAFDSELARRAKPSGRLSAPASQPARRRRASH